MNPPPASAEQLAAAFVATIPLASQRLDDPILTRLLTDFLRQHSPAADWQPIATAPNDGTDFLAIWGDHDESHVVCIRDGKCCRAIDREGDEWMMPTHWQPLPPAPGCAADHIADTGKMVSPAPDVRLRELVARWRAEASGLESTMEEYQSATVRMRRQDRVIELRCCARDLEAALPSEPAGEGMVDGRRCEIVGYDTGLKTTRGGITVYIIRDRDNHPRFLDQDGKWRDGFQMCDAHNTREAATAFIEGLTEPTK